MRRTIVLLVAAAALVGCSRRPTEREIRERDEAAVLEKLLEAAEADAGPEDTVSDERDASKGPSAFVERA